MRHTKPFLVLVLCLALVGACSSSSGYATGPDGGLAPLLDVGGFRVAEEGVAISAQPTYDAIREAAVDGYRTVVNFRTDGEGGDPVAEGNVVTSAGMKYVRIPVAPGGLAFEQADRLAEAIADTGAKPALLHCRSGQRAVAVWALYLAKHRGKTPEEALIAADAAGIGRDMRAELERRLLDR
jgi:uncharacterized protein (TIGR01244 family)